MNGMSSRMWYLRVTATRGWRTVWETITAARIG